MKLITFLFFCLLSHSVFVQNPYVDSLVNVLNHHSEEDIEKSKLLNVLAFEYLFIDLDQSEKYIQINEKLLEKIDFKDGKAGAIYYKARVSENRSDYTKAIAYYNEAKKLYEILGQKRGISYSINGIGNCYNYQGDLEKALIQYKKSLVIDESLDDLYGVAGGYNNIGNIYADQGNYPEALLNYKKAKIIHEELNDPYGIGQSYNNMGTIYGEQANFPKAIEGFQKAIIYYDLSGRVYSKISALDNIGSIYKMQGYLKKALMYCQKSLKLAKLSGDKIDVIRSLNSIGEIYKDQLMYDSAFVYYEDALKISEEIKDKKGVAISLNNLASLYLVQGKTTEALLFYEKALGVNIDLGVQLGICKSQLGIANVYHSNQDYEKALQYVLESQKTAIKLDLLELRKEISKLLSEIYEATGNYKDAFINHKNYKVFNDSIFNKKNIKKIAEIEYEFKYKEQIEKAEVREVLLKDKVKVSKIDLEQSQKNTFIAIIIILICLILIGGILFYIKLRTEKEKNQKMIIEQKLLRSQMTPHFIFNSLAVLQGMILNNENEKSVYYLSKFSKLLRIVLENSRDKMVLLKHELEAIDNYITLQNFDTNSPISFDVQVDKKIELEKIKIPPMLIQPFIENAIIHAFDDTKKDKRIDLKLSFENSNLICTVADNGIGIENRKSKAPTLTKKSLATLISSERIEMLSKDFKMEGSITIENRKENDLSGTLVTLIIPYLTH